jgi:hypothetical protein
MKFLNPTNPKEPARSRRSTVTGASVAVALLLFFTGCSDDPAPPRPADDSAAAEPSSATAASTTIPVTPEDLKRRLNSWQAQFIMQGNDITEASLYQSGIRNITPLKGLPLIAIDLGMTQVTDLSPLAGMRLQRLDLENTPVADLAVLRGMPLTVLKLQQTKVTDFTVLEGMPLQQLNLLDLPFTDSHFGLIHNAPLETIWLAGTQVTDLTPLPLQHLESLDIARTSVSSLAPLSRAAKLKRLNIADTPVEDLTSLAGLKLQRITLTPSRIKQGFETLRQMSTLTQIQTDLSEPLSAADFWKRFDLGLYKPADPQPEAPK